MKDRILQEQIISLLKSYNKQYELLNESRKEVLMNQYGLNENIAKIFDEVGKKLSIWLVRDVFMPHFIEEAKSYTREKIPESEFEKYAKLKINNQPPNSLIQLLSNIMDYIIEGLGGNKSSLNNLKLMEIIGKANEWHKSLKIGDSKINYIEKNPIILDFRDEDGNGYYWVDLQTKDSKEECDRMGHCGRSHLGYLYSLRSYQSKENPKGGQFKVNRSHLTAAISNDGVLYQLKGPKNSKPKEEYHQYITPLFYALGGGGEEEDYLIQGFGKEYAAQDDFKLEDLPMETLKTIYESRPELFKGNRRLKEKMVKLGIGVERESLPTEFETTINHSYVYKYIDGDEVGFDVTRNFWNVTIHLSEIILSGDYGSVEKYIEIHNPLDVIDDILENYVSDELKNYIRDIIMIDVPDNEKEKYKKIPLSKLMRETETGTDIEPEIRNEYNRALIEPLYEEYYATLMNTLEKYGRVSNQINQDVIYIYGDINELVDVNDPSVLQIYDSVEDEFDELYMDIVFEKLVISGVMPKPTWDKPSFGEIQIDLETFNKRLNKQLVAIEKIIRK